MSLTYLDAKTIGDALSCAWKKQLDTSQDPANGKWYTKGANGDDIGLYGGLTDSIPSSATLDNDAATVTDLGATSVDSAIINNMNGLTPSASVTLSSSYSSSVSDSHTVTESITLGTSFSFQVEDEVTKEGATYSVNFNFTSTETTSSTTTTGDTFGLTVQVNNIATGTVKQVKLMAYSQQVTVPYTVKVSVSGTTETWFENTVNGHYNYSATAGEAFGWINSDDCAGSDSSSYADAGNGIGTVTITGTVVTSQVTTFTTETIDITDDPSLWETTS